MGISRRSRTKAQVDAIARALGVTSSQERSGIESLLDTPVSEVQRVDQNVKYFPVVEASPYEVPLQELIAGVNIVGVRTAGDFTVRIPLRAREEQVITVVDERGAADVNPILIEVA